MSRQVVDWDEFVGHFEAVDNVSVLPRVSGYIQSIGFQDGNLIHKGQVLFTIDRRPYQALLDQARGQEAGAQTALADARVELRRSQQLYAAQVGNQQDLQTRQTTLGQAQATLIADKALTQTAALNLGFTRVVAPISGRVSDRKVSPGNLVSADSTVLTSIVSVDPIRFLFVESEAPYMRHQEASKAQGGLPARSPSNPVEIAIEGAPSYHTKGWMDFVDNTVDQNSGTIRARAVVENPQAILTPGLFGHMRLIGSQPRDALVVPDTAVVADQSRQVVYVVDRGSKVATRVVEPAQLVDGLRVIASGLSPQDEVIIDGLGAAKSGDKVRIKVGSITATSPGASPAPSSVRRDPKPDHETLTSGPALASTPRRSTPSVEHAVPTPAQ